MVSLVFFNQARLQIMAIDCICCIEFNENLLKLVTLFGVTVIYVSESTVLKTCKYSDYILSSIIWDKLCYK
jgi:hypothetical protein